MLIAAIRSGDALAGKAVSYSEDDGRFWLTGVGEIEPAKLLEYDAAGKVDWADDDIREWVIGLAKGVSQPPPTPSGPSGAAPPPATETPGPAVVPAAAPAEAVPSSAGTTRPDGGPDLEPDGEPAAPPPPAATAKAADGDHEEAAGTAPDAPVAVTAAQSLRRVRQQRPEFVESKKSRWNLSDTQKRMVVFGLIGLVMVVAIIVLAVWGRTGDSSTGETEKVEWVEVYATSSDDPVKGIDFVIETDRQRVDFEFTPVSAQQGGTYSIALVPATASSSDATGNIVADGRFDAGSSGSKGSVDVSVEPGAYNLRVIAANSTWTATVSQAKE